MHVCACVCACVWVCMCLRVSEANSGDEDEEIRSAAGSYSSQAGSGLADNKAVRGTGKGRERGR